MSTVESDLNIIISSESIRIWIYYQANKLHQVSVNMEINDAVDMLIFRLIVGEYIREEQQKDYDN